MGRMGRADGRKDGQVVWTDGQADERTSKRTDDSDSGDERGRFGRAANAGCILYFRGLRFGWADEQVDAWADGQADERTDKLTDESYPDYERVRFEREPHTGSIL